MAPAYKVEELLALRDSVSESAVSLDKFADEDVIKEHVLRPTASAQLIGRKSDRSLRTFVPRAAVSEEPREVTPEVIQATVPANKRPSPSPSVKRGKAERLLKEHGSPPGLRVTAGGRIVPGDLPPLGARPSFNIYNPQVLRVAPGNIMTVQSQQSSDYTGARIEVVGGQPVVVVGDRMFAFPTVNGGSTMSAATPVPSETIVKHDNGTVPLSTQGDLPGLTFGPSHASSQTPFAKLDLPTLKAQQTVKKQELRTVEQTEVLQSSHQTEAWRATMIEKKKSLIVELDNLRKQISALELESTTTIAQHSGGKEPVHAMTAPASLPSFIPPYQQPLTQTMYGYPATDPYATMMMYPLPFGALPGFPSVSPTPFVPPPVHPVQHSPGVINRRSRAIEIKPPHDEPTKGASSALDPKSPTYEPRGSLDKDAIPPKPSLNKLSPWRQQEVSQSDMQLSRALSHKPSLSSLDTTDFFPTNTHEHSSTRVAPSTGASQSTRHENKTVPSTPEKSWPASPWNESYASRSRNDKSAPKIGSWPEAFGKPQSFLPFEKEAFKQSSVPAQRHTMQTDSSLKTISSNILHAQDHSQRRTVLENLWPLEMPKAVTNIPSTYQEGFQAGYDHTGMPDSPEVLHGCIQGLLSFLADSLGNRRSSSSARDLCAQTVDSHTQSLHSLIASSAPHESANSTIFSHKEAPVGSQENFRSSHGNGTMSPRRDSAYGPQGTIQKVTGSFVPAIEPAHERRQLDDLGAKHPSPAGMFPARLSTAYRSVPSHPHPENEMSKPVEKGIGLRSTVQAAKSDVGHQFSSNQLVNRTNGNNQTIQRFYPAQKKVVSSGFEGSNTPVPRCFTNNRVPGLDGAMDDLADLIIETSIDGRSPPGPPGHAAAAAQSVEAGETSASCLKPSYRKGKQKMTCSPAKAKRPSQDVETCSPKKAGEHSPAKAKLDQVTNRFRRSKKDDPRGMSSEDKVKRSEKWRKCFEYIKQTEKAEIDDYREEEGGRNEGRR